MRSVVEPGLFLERKSVHVGANQQKRTFANLRYGDKSPGLSSVHIFADVFGDRVTELAQIRGEFDRGVFFMVRQFWTAMKVFVCPDQCW